MELTIKITGTASLLMHSNGLADPISDDAKRMKRLSAKRTKTDEDHIAMRQIEFESSLYLDPELGPYLPGANIAKAFLIAARIRRNGPKVERGLIVISPINQLQYEGPRDVSGLWNNPKFKHTVPVKLNGKSTVMRCRPIFQEWSCTATAMLNPTVLPPDELAEIAVDAGQMVGVGDWRPWHGRFNAEVAK